METNISAMKLIREEFAPVTMNEMKELTPEDRAQLASAIAREKGLSQEQVSFELVPY